MGFFPKKTLVGLFVIASAGYLEYTGYALLDNDKGKNALCQIDPTCRHLTEGEVDYAEGIFGDAIDYNSVKVFNRSWFGFVFDVAHAPNGNMYMPTSEYYVEDYSAASNLKTTYIHEMGHVYQKQSGINLVAQFFSERKKHNGNYDRAYEVEIRKLKEGDSLGIEQEATLLEAFTFKSRGIEYILNTDIFPYSVRGNKFTQEDALSRECNEVKPVVDYFDGRIDFPVFEPCRYLYKELTPLDK